MPFLNSSLALPVTLRNPLLTSSYPRRGNIFAFVDTGYSGFLLVPRRIFEELKLHQLATRVVDARLADGRVIKLSRAPGSIRFDEISVTVDGLIDTHQDVSEVLIGMDGIRNLILTVDSCRRKLLTDVCDNA